MITIRFSEPANYTNGAQGITITNTTTGEDYIITAVDGNGTDTITYGGYWETEPVYGEVIQWKADGTDYTNNEGASLSNQTITLTNCTAEVSWVLGFDGTSYAELSVPFYASNDYEIEVDFSLGEGTLAMPLMGGSDGTTNSLVIDASNGSSRVRAFGYAGGVLLDILTVTVSLPFGSKHTAKLSVVGGEATISCDGVVGSTETWGDHSSAFADYIARDSSAYLVGSVYEVRITDNTTPDNSVSWKLNSGPPVYEYGADIMRPDDWQTITGTLATFSGRTAHILEAMPDFGSVKANQGEVYTGAYELNFTIARDGAAPVDCRASVRIDGNSVYKVDGTYTRLGQAQDTHILCQVSNDDFYGDITINSVLPVTDILSDGTFYEPSEEHGVLPDIMRPDEWTRTVPAIVTGSGYTSSWTGDNGGGTYDFYTVYATSDLHTGVHILNSMVTNRTLGGCTVNMGDQPQSPARIQSNGLFTAWQNCVDRQIRVKNDSAFFDGDVKILSVLPVPKALIYIDVEAADWSLVA